MSVSATLKYARLSAQKARLVTNQVKGLPVEKALDVLLYSSKKASGIVKKLLESVIANAENNEGLDIDSLVLSNAFVDEGPSFKRFKPRAKGRSNRIIKRSCHITVVVAERVS